MHLFDEELLKELFGRKDFKKIDSFLEQVHDLQGNYSSYIQRIREEPKPAGAVVSPNYVRRIFGNDHYSRIDSYIKGVNEAAYQLIDYFKDREYGLYLDIMRRLAHTSFINFEGLSLEGAWYLFDLNRYSPIYVGVTWKNSHIHTGFFGNCEFLGSVRFYDVQFFQLADFTHCDFREEVYFNKCHFGNGLTFAGSIFQGECISLRSGAIEGRLELYGTEFKQEIISLDGVNGISYLDADNVTLTPHIDMDVRALKYIERRLIDQGESDSARKFHNCAISIETKRTARRLGKSLFNPLLFLRNAGDLFYIVLSLLYLVTNLRGTSILLPFAWLLGGSILMGYLYSGHILLNASLINQCPGTWYCALTEQSDFTLGLLYSFQATLWPTQLLTAQSALLNASLCHKIIAVCHSLISTVLLYLLIVGVKIKFKIEGGK